MNITVFLGSRNAQKEIYETSVIKLAQEIAKRNHTLVYGGAKVGTMGILANTALEHGAKVIGVMPKILSEKEIIHEHLTEVYLVSDMHERKMKLQELADVFIAMPGGCGTMEEIFEVITWNQIGVHQKPYCFVNIDGIYDGIKLYLEHALSQNFMSKENFDKIHFFDSIEALVSSGLIK